VYFSHWASGKEERANEHWLEYDCRLKTIAMIAIKIDAKPRANAMVSLDETCKKVSRLTRLRLGRDRRILKDMYRSQTRQGLLEIN
jgi:hypothetical protein